MSGQPSGAHHAALAVASRRRILDALRAASQPLDAAAVADVVGLHVTTARFHLEVLERAGLVSSAPERAGRPGRPRQLYVAVEAAANDSAHRWLAEAVVGVLAADDGDVAERAERAGRLWAQRQLPGDVDLPWDEAAQRIEELFDRLGFAPRVVDDNRGRHVELDRCPFRDLARSYPHVVCSVHTGLLRGSLRRLNVPGADAAELRSFVRPELCIADLPDSGGVVNRS